MTGEPVDPEQRRHLMSRFRQMYVAKHLEYDGLNTDTGYLETALSDNDRMPMTFFIEYNNAWWFEVITRIDVPMISYDPDSDSATIILDIYYHDDILRAAQHVHFDGESITRIRTYAPSSFFLGRQPLIQLDFHGNAIWLETGYDLRTSTQSALGFLQTPRGRQFADDPATADVVQRITANLRGLGTRWETADAGG